MKAVIPAVFEEYRNYFIDIEQSLSTEAHAALNEVAAGLPAPDNPRLLRQLVDRDYIEVDRAEPSGYRFQVPLLHEWWVRR